VTERKLGGTERKLGGTILSVTLRDESPEESPSVVKKRIPRGSCFLE